MTAETPQGTGHIQRLEWLSLRCYALQPFQPLMELRPMLSVLFETHGVIGVA
jgi:hypothetical protein